MDGEVSESREEGFYRAPDSAHTIGDEEISPLGFEQIVIGTQVWTRDASGWSLGDVDSVCYTALTKMDVLLRIGRELNRFTDAGDGPARAGESTRRYRYVNDDYGEYFVAVNERVLDESSVEREVSARIRNTYEGAVATVEVTVGQQTARAYDYSFSVEGPNVQSRIETSISHYDEPVEIEPPAEARPLDESRRSCPDFDSDFPWIPAAIAAVVGPLAFLLASSFVWRRL